MKKRGVLLGLFCCVSFLLRGAEPNPEMLFRNPPQQAKTGVWWHWMGCHVTEEGIRRDLAYFKETGIGCATIFGMADLCTPWATSIPGSRTEGLIAFTEPWWKWVRFAAQEGRRLGIDIGLHNCPGYTSTGGPWIPPELAMQELAFAEVTVRSDGTRKTYAFPQPEISLKANALFPVCNPKTGNVEKPDIPSRRSHCREIAVLAYPAGLKPLAPRQILEVTAQTNDSGHLTYAFPVGEWKIVRILHHPMGAFIQPAQWEAFGLECDKMNPKAVAFHLDHVLGEMRKHLGDEMGKGLRHVLLDSYEAGVPNWTPRMREEFQTRRGYDLLPYLLTFQGVCVQDEKRTAQFKKDFQRTVADLYRDVLFKIMREKLHAAGLEFSCEPYGGPFFTHEVSVSVDRMMTEFWTDRNRNHGIPQKLDWHRFKSPNGTHRLIEAEAFTGQPANSQWDETPMMLKRVGDVQYLRGVNRFLLHTTPLQPWGDEVKPGMVMGRWGTHFGRTQTWAKLGKAWFDYMARCQSLLQWGERMKEPAMEMEGPRGSIGCLARGRAGERILFMANVTEKDSACVVVLPKGIGQVKWMDPVTGAMEEKEMSGGRVRCAFAPWQSGFLWLREQKGAVSPKQTVLGDVVQTLTGPWEVVMGKRTFSFPDLQDWTKQEKAEIRYFSGTAVYRKTFTLTAEEARRVCGIRLGANCEQLTRIVVNGVDCGTIWCAPWETRIPASVVRTGENTLRMEHVNVWANRLIGDEQYPSDCEWKEAPMPGGRYLAAYPKWFREGTPRPSMKRTCFTPWNYFTKDSPLIPSGVLGPVTLRAVAR